MLAIGDTVTAYAEHKVVTMETAAYSQRVQSVHGCPITMLLPMDHPLVVSRGQTFRLILLKRRRPAEELVEAIVVLTLQKRPHLLFVNHTMNVRLARPPLRPPRKDGSVWTWPWSPVFMPEWRLALAGRWRSYLPQLVL